MSLVTGEWLEVFSVDEFTINEHFFEASLLSSKSVFLMETFAGF